MAVMDFGAKRQMTDHIWAIRDSGYLVSYILDLIVFFILTKVIRHC